MMSRGSLGLSPSFVIAPVSQHAGHHSETAGSTEYWITVSKRM